MVVEGLKLSLLGMSMVFIFLVLIVAAINVATAALIGYTRNEEKEIAEEARKAQLKSSGRKDDKNLIAVISAAVHAFRNRK